MATPAGGNHFTYFQGTCSSLIDSHSENRANKMQHPSGFGTGVTMNALFTAVQVSVDRAHIAPAVSMVFLASGLGTVLGLAASSAVYQAGLRSTLESRLVYQHLDADLRNRVSHSSVFLPLGFKPSCPEVSREADHSSPHRS